MSEKGYYTTKYEDFNHSWGYGAGISTALLFVADELHELNKTIKKMIK